MSASATSLLVFTATLLNLWKLTHSSPFVYFQDRLDSNPNRGLEFMSRDAASSDDNSEDYSCQPFSLTVATLCDPEVVPTKWIRCQPNGTVTIRRGYWVGYYNSSMTSIAVGRCPFCQSMYTQQLGMYVNIELSDQCVSNRTGLLCSQCCKNTSPSLNTYYHHHCSDCEDTGVQSFLGFLCLQLTCIAVLFSFMFVFDFSPASGALSSSILFAQLITTTLNPSGNGMIPLVRNNSYDDVPNQLLEILYGIWTLNFFTSYPIPYCFATSDSSANLQAIAIDYVVAVMALVPFAAFAIFQAVSNSCSYVRRRFDDNMCVNHCQCSPGRIFKTGVRFNYNNSLVTVFLAALLLSYVKFTTTTFHILTATYINVLNVSSNNKEHYVSHYAYFSGNESYENASVVIAFLILIVIVNWFPLVLLCLKYEKKREHWPSQSPSRLAKAARKASLFINVFILRPIQKDLRWGSGDEPPGTILFKFSCGLSDYRWMAGWYFLLRLIIYATYAALDSFMDQLIAQELICIIALLMTVIIRPYRRRLHNRIESFNFSLLVFINALTIYQYHLTTTGQTLSVAAYVIQYMLAFLPFCIISSYLPVKLIRNLANLNQIGQYMVSDDKEPEDEEHSTDNPLIAIYSAAVLAKLQYMWIKSSGFLEKYVYMKWSRNHANCRRAEEAELIVEALDDVTETQAEDEQHDPEEGQTETTERSLSVSESCSTYWRKQSRRNTGRRSLRELNLTPLTETTDCAYELMKNSK